MTLTPPRPMHFIPQTTQAIDAKWLTDALSERFPGVAVRDVEVTSPVEQTNHHSTLRVVYDEAAGAPAVMFCKSLPSHEPHRSLVAATGMGPREARFYGELADALEMRTPRCFVARQSQDGDFVLMLEDLIEGGCSVSDGVECVAPDAAAVALDDLAALHLYFADDARRKKEAGWLGPPMHQPSYANAMFEVALSRHRDRLSDDFAEIAGIYMRSSDALYALWQEGPTTVIHGDPHIGNLFDDRGRVGFLDWGIISTGTPLRDVSYFLALSLTPDDRRRHERALLRHYLDRWNAGASHAIDFDEGWRAHRLHAAYAVVACCQIVTFPEYADPARRVFMEAFLGRAEAAIADLDSLSLLRSEGL